MKSEQLKNNIERTAKTILATTAATLALAGCAEQNKQESGTPNPQQKSMAVKPAPESKGSFIRVGERGLIVPANPATGEPDIVPNELIINRRNFPSAKPGEKCFSEDASPAIVVGGNGFSKDPQYITTQTDTFHDAYEVDYRHLAGDTNVGYIQIIQRPESNNKYPWMRIVTLDEIPSRGPGYVELNDSKPGTTLGMLVDTAKDSEHWADVTVQVCTNGAETPEPNPSAPIDSNQI